MGTPTATAPEAPAEVPDEKPDLLKIIEKIGRQWDSIPATTLVTEKSTHAATLTPREVAYYMAAMRNMKADERRRKRTERKLFTSLDALMDQESDADEEASKPFYAGPSTPDDCEASYNKSLFRETLLKLPIQLAVIALVLPYVKGNISKLARQLDQPQRRTARQVERIQKHFLKHGLA